MHFNDEDFSKFNIYMKYGKDKSNVYFCIREIGQKKDEIKFSLGELKQDQDKCLATIKNLTSCSDSDLLDIEICIDLFHVLCEDIQLKV